MARAGRDACPRCASADLAVRRCAPPELCGVEWPSRACRGCGGTGRRLRRGARLWRAAAGRRT